MKQRRYQPDATTLWVKVNHPNNKFHDVFIDGNYELSKEEFQEYVNNQRRHIKPIERIQNEVDKYTSELDLENTIGLHIRSYRLKRAR